jgi:ABC-type uncharacterized transport system permease subunit
MTGMRTHNFGLEAVTMTNVRHHMYKPILGLLKAYLLSVFRSSVCIYILKYVTSEQLIKTLKIFLMATKCTK